MGLSVDVVIPVLDGWHMTERCLEHLERQTLAHEVVLVDNGSTDGTPERAPASFPRVRVLGLGRNAGFGPACNEGARLGHGDVILLLSNDAYCRPDFLERLAAAFESSPRAGSVAPLLVRTGERQIDSVGITIDRTLASFIRLGGRPLADAARPAPRLAGPGGGADAYRRAAFEAAGGFDEHIDFYFSDTELALRIARAGWEAVAAPDAVAVHLGSATTGHRSRRSRTSGGWGRGYMLRRYGVLRRAPVRTLATEAIVVCADIVLSRDAQALGSRVRGWRAARGLPRLEWPPASAIDGRLSFAESMRMRWTAR